MEEYSPELKEVIAVIHQEHRRTQIVFGISLIILSIIMMVLVPGIIRMETSSTSQQRLYVDSPSPQPGVFHTSSSTSTHGAAATSTGSSTNQTH